MDPPAERYQRMKQYTDIDKESTDYKDPSVLEELYWEEELSTVDIAELADTHPKTISERMERHGIPRRDRIEAVKMKSTVDYAYYSMGGGGYMTWVSQYSGERDVVKVARLLAVAKYGFDAVKGKHVHHRKSIPWLNYHDNIEILDPSDHLRLHTEGDKNPQAKLTEEEVKEVVELAKAGEMTQREIADKYGISQGHVSDLKNGKRR